MSDPTKEELVLSFKQLEIKTKWFDAARRVPVTFDPDKPGVLPAEHILMLPVKYKGTKIAKVLTWYAWKEVHYCPLSTCIVAIKWPPGVTI